MLYLYSFAVRIYVATAGLRIVENEAGRFGACWTEKKLLLSELKVICSPSWFYSENKTKKEVNAPSIFAALKKEK